MLKTWKCPKCGRVWNLDGHYYRILDMQNMMTLMSGGNEIKNMCGCGYIEYEEENNV